MKFPGFSMEKSLHCFMEEYSSLDRTKETLFIEVRKVKTMWLFDFDQRDPKLYDEGAFNPNKRVSLFTSEDPVRTSYSMYCRFHKNHLRPEYWDTDGFR